MMSKCLLMLIVCQTLLVRDSLQTGTCNFTSSMFRPGLMEDVQELLKQEVLRQRYIGESSQYAALSCDEIKEIKPCQTSGEYWIKVSSGSVQKHICNFGSNLVTTWTPVIKLDMQRYNYTCPGGLDLVANGQTNNKRLCRSPLTAGGCYSLTFPVGGKEYKWVRGKVVGYQVGTLNSFDYSTRSIDVGVYVDGLSITSGHNPRRHIWTYAAGWHIGSGSHGCPCTESNYDLSYIPSFVGDSYYCDVGTHGTSSPSGLVLSNALWDGENCAPSTTCCDNPNLPWFETELPNPTTDDIEFRICRTDKRSNEDVYLEAIELYIR